MENKENAVQFARRLLFRERRTLSLLVLLIILAVMMSQLNPRSFPTTGNLRSMMQQMAEMGLFTLAMLVVLIPSGLNLSTVALGNLSAAGMALISNGTLFGNLLTSDAARIAVGILLALLIGLLGGALNGLIVSRLQLNAILVTAATAQLFEGVTQMATKGNSILSTVTGIVTFGNMALFNIIPNIFIVMAVCYIVAEVFYNKTKYGESARLLGASGIVNTYSGNNNNRTIMVTYMFSGLLSAVGGMTVFAKMGIVRSDYGSTISNQALLTLVLAGLLVMGGAGKIINVLLSLAVLQVISTGLNLAGVVSFAKSVCWGVMLMVVVVFNTREMSELVGRWKKAVVRKLGKGHIKKSR